MIGDHGTEVIQSDDVLVGDRFFDQRLQSDGYVQRADPGTESLARRIDLRRCCSAPFLGHGSRRQCRGPVLLQVSVIDC